MDWRKTLLSIALVGGCIWCLGMVQKAHSEERAISVGGEQKVLHHEGAATPKTTENANG